MRVNWTNRALQCCIYIFSFTPIPLLCISIYTGNRYFAIAALAYYMLDKTCALAHMAMVREQHKQALYELEHHSRLAKEKAMKHIREFIQEHGGNPCEACHHDVMTCVECQGFNNFEVTLLSLNRLQNGENS